MSTSQMDTHEEENNIHMQLWYSWCARETENLQEHVRFLWAAPNPSVVKW